MHPLSHVLGFVATLALVLGLVFAAQGSGLFPYPARSFMIEQTAWIWRGLLLAGVGAAGVYLSRRMRRW